MKPDEAKRVLLAIKAVEFRKELDELLAKHEAKLSLGWNGKWAYLQLQWPHENLALTLAKCSKGGKCHYYTEADEKLVQPCN